MQEDLQLEYIDNKLTATIDNETLSLNVYKIVKSKTHFVTYNSIDTVLNAPINIDLFLGYTIDNDEDNEDEEIYPIEKGFVTLTITSVSGQTKYVEEVINFIDGQINTQIINNLNIGEYLLTIDYAGNKYYESTSLTIQFTIGQREVKCLFESEVIEAYPNENINIDLTLIDALNDKKISNCLINYYFNNMKYMTQTNEQGHATLNITVPDVDPTICPMNIENNTLVNDEVFELESNVFYFDDDGNLQYINNNTNFIVDGTESNNENITINIIESDDDEEESEPEYNLVPQYELEIEIDSSIYKLVSDTSIVILLKKYLTEVIYIATNNNHHVHIEGDVITYNDKNEVSNVQYGNVLFDIAEVTPHPQETKIVDNTGHFSFDTNIISHDSANIPVSDPILYSPTLTTTTTLKINTDSNKVTRNYIEKHKIGFLAKTESGGNAVPYGMMTFIITQNDNEIYRYVTEMDINGEAVFYFDVSAIGKYKIKAIYHNIFEYQQSESQSLEYEII